MNLSLQKDNKPSDPSPNSAGRSFKRESMKAKDSKKSLNNIYSPSPS